MPFILLEIAMQAVAPSGAIGSNLSEAPENHPDGSPEMSDRNGDGFQMHGSKSETGLRDRGSSARAAQRPVARGRWWEDEESN